AMGEKPGVLLLDEAAALSLDHLLPPPQAREASARLVAALCEKLDAVDAATARVMVIAATSRTDVIDPSLVAPGRLDHLVEIALPDPAGQQEILDLQRAKLERKAGRALFGHIDYGKILPLMGGMSGGHIAAQEGQYHGQRGRFGLKYLERRFRMLTGRKTRKLVERRARHPEFQLLEREILSVRPRSVVDGGAGEGGVALAVAARHPSIRV